LALANLGSAALAESAGCALINSGALDSVSTTAGGSQTKSTGSVAFEAGEVITETFNRNATTVVTDFALSSLPVVNDQSTGSPADGDQLQLTIPGSGNFDVTSRIGEVAPGAPTFASVTVACQGVTAPTTTSLASSRNPSERGDSVTFTATVAPSSGAGTPTGSLVFTVDGSAQPAIALDGSGNATLTLSSLTVGTHTIQASYGGDATFLVSNSSVLSQVVGARTATTTVQSSLNPSELGEAVTFTATVAPTSGAGTPTGNVVFTIDGATQPAAALDGSGKATLTLSDLTTGTHTIQASYGGDAVFLTSTSPALSQVVDAQAQNATATTVQSSLNPSEFGDAVTFTATVAPTSGTGTPTGAVVFTIGGVAQPAAALDGSGNATLTVSNLTAGTHAVSASYGGDAAFLASNSSVLSQVVRPQAQDPTTTTVQSSLNPSKLGEAITFTATVAPVGGTGTPTGTVVFTIDGAAQPAAALDATGKAALTLANLTVGTHPIQASYGGNAAFLASASSVLNQVVEAGNQDSRDLREMQVMTTKIVAQTSGQSIQGAVDNAIDDGFANGSPITATGQSMHFNFAAAPKSTAAKAAAQPLDALAFEQRAGAAGSDESASQAIDASLGQTGQAHAMASAGDGDATGVRWRPWVNVRYTDWDADDDQADVGGNQTNALVGVTYKISPKLLVGMFGGYEDFSYSSVPLDATMDGNGWTVGAYLGWRLAPALRFDAAVARSAIDYSGTAGTATGEFDGERWFFTSGLTGRQPVGAFIVEPSAKIYVLWEDEDAYTDSLGTAQPQRDFSTGRASGGLKLSYPIVLDGGRSVPYAGVYGDYYFSEDDAAAALTFADVIEDGWSARFIGGFAFTIPSGMSASLTGEIGGIGAGGAPHYTGRANLSVPF